MEGSDQKMLKSWNKDLSRRVAFLDFGFLISLQPTFYPTEAEKKGATPSQVIWNTFFSCCCCLLLLLSLFLSLLLLLLSLLLSLLLLLLSLPIHTGCSI